MSGRILPQATSLGVEFGNNLGELLQRRNEQQYQGNQVRGALEKLNELPQNASSFDQMKNLIGAFAGIPGGEQYAAQLFPHLMRQLQNQQAFGNQGEGGIGAQGGQPGMVGMQGGPSLEPGFGTQKFSAEQINERVRNSIDPQGTRQLLNDYNASIEAQDLERVAAIEQRLGGQLTPSQSAVASRLDKDPRFSKITNTQLRADAIAKEVQKYTAAMDEFEKGASKRPTNILRGDYTNKIKNLHHQAQRFVDLGQRDEVIGALKKNGWSENEVAEILNPLPPTTEKMLKQYAPLLSKADGKITLNAFEDKRQKLDRALEKAIKPGGVDPSQPGVLSPGTSLLLVRNALVKGGADYREVNSAINRLVASGKIALSPEQNNELQLLSQSPARSYNLEEILFGSK